MKRIWTTIVLGIALMLVLIPIPSFAAATGGTAPALQNSGQSPVATLQADQDPSRGQEFVTIYGLQSLPQAGVQAQQFTVQYDPAVLDFETATAYDIQNLDILDVSNDTPGTAQIIAVRLGAEHALTSNTEQLFALHWKAKLSSQAASTDITISDAYVADSRGVVTPASGGKLTVHISGDNQELSPQAVLHGTDSVRPDGQFDLTYGLIHVADSFYAQDLTFTYDPAKVEFVSADSLKDGFAVIDKKVTEGKVRIVAASMGEGHEVNANGDLLKLIWKAKTVTASTSATISLSNSSLALGDGKEKNLDGVSFVVQITTQIPGDLNGDGKFSIGDLAILARYYGATSSDPNWSIYKIGDLNNDGRIDIEDLVILAKKIVDQ